MKLAEALLQRADMKNHLDRLQERITQNARIQEGDTPEEDPLELLEEALRILREGEELVIRINKVNLEAILPNGMTMMEAIVRRTSLEKEHSLLLRMVKSAQKDSDRYTRNEIRWISVINIREMQQRIQDTAQRIRELNTLIQECNWLTTLP